MIYVGIDIAKLNHFAAAISSDGEILIEPFKFTNDYDSFYLLLSKLAPLDQNSIIIGLKSTAHYGDNLVRFLISKDFKVCVLNPIQTSSMRKNNIRKTKTDKVDTFVIAKTLMMQDSLRFMTQWTLYPYRFLLVFWLMWSVSDLIVYGFLFQNPVQSPIRVITDSTEFWNY